MQERRARDPPHGAEARDGQRPRRAGLPDRAHEELIEAAGPAGTRFAVKVYDGSDNGKRIYDTLALVGRRIEPGAGHEPEAAAAGNPELAKLPRWPMTISYFTPGTGDRTPVYTISFELYENGVSRALKLDYGDFALKGELASLELLPYSACQR